jgi:diguanylate cyclase (GGDEF)-like protein
LTAPNECPIGDHDPGPGRSAADGVAPVSIDESLLAAEQTLADTGISREIRERSAPRRELAAGARVAEAEKRDRSAQARDLAAAERDLAAEARDEAMRVQEAATVDDVLPRNAVGLLLRAADLRRRAREQRALTAAHRGQARLDRLAAAEDRQQAARERAGALADREALMGELVLAATDPVTGARMRASGIDELELEMARSRRAATPLIVAYVDVIGLKACNDALGHAAGDELLRRVVTTIREHVRTYDLVVRVGGDEFLCAMSGTTLPEVHQRFRQVARALATREPAGITAGFAELQPEETVEALIERADADLLAHRRNVPSGRDEAVRSPGDV